MEKFKQLAAKCKASVYLTVNEHRGVYEDVKTFLINREALGEIAPEVLEEMVRRDTIVEVHFYPDTPVGFYQVFHYDIDAAMDEALAILVTEGE